jgi:AcrR family transcriptional regulator
VPDTPRRRTRAEQRAETRRRLLDGAAEVIRERGLGAASVEAIAAAAGFTRGAFYSNFDTKDELFLELLQDRVYRNYRAMVERAPLQEHLTIAQRLDSAARELADLQRGDDGRWLFELWLELLAHAARDREFAALAASFWSGTRAMLTELTEQTYAGLDLELPTEARHLATAQIGLDIGLAVQHMVDPEAVPLEVYPELWRVLFGSLLGLGEA